METRITPETASALAATDAAAAFSLRMQAATQPELADLIRYYCAEASAAEQVQLAEWARTLCRQHYGTKIYFRGLIEFSSYCRNNCYYCGLRRDNTRASRYRLSDAAILACCQEGYQIGFRTFVLQSGEDPYYMDARLCSLVSGIKKRYPDCAVTLSVGERPYDSYQRLLEAGADRYLLRHETADAVHYQQLHPPELSLEQRQQCLHHLKQLGYQVGAGFMVDSPGQTDATLAQDFIFLRELQPHMIGIGPFIPHGDTPFARHPRPTANRTLILLSLLRIMLPKVLLPATTALATIDEQGRTKGFLAGANVVMPNLSPAKHRSAYAIYDHKLSTGLEAAEHVQELARLITALGLTPNFSRGDYVDCCTAKE